MAKASGTLVAVDLGAGSGRVMAGSRSGDALKLREVHRFAQAPARVDGLLRWDTEFLEASIRQGLAKIDAGDRVVSLGLDNWAVDFVLVGADGKPLEMARYYRNEHPPGLRGTDPRAIGRAVTLPARRHPVAAF